MADKREVKYKDENCYNEAVLAYREQFSLMPNAGYRRDIAVTVKTYEDLCIWQDLIAHWSYFKDGKWKPRNPLDIKGILTIFEFKQREAQRQKDEIRKRRDAAREDNRQRVSLRNSGSPMLTLSRNSNGWKG